MRFINSINNRILAFFAEKTAKTGEYTFHANELAIAVGVQTQMISQRMRMMHYKGYCVNYNPPRRKHRAGSWTVTRD